MVTKVDSPTESIKKVFLNKFVVDFYQREYVWERKHIEDMITDLSNDFLRNWASADHKLQSVKDYEPYYMGTIVITENVGSNAECAIIDGQQRITSLTLLLIYVYREYKHLELPDGFLQLIYGDSYGEKLFNLNVEERLPCMMSLLEEGDYIPKEGDSPSIFNLVARFKDIKECWSHDINDDNAVAFAYWLQEKVLFTTVETNNEDFAYVIFETMNDRGLSLTQVEMLRSYLLAKIDSLNRNFAMQRFDEILSNLKAIKLASNSKAEFEFFKMYFRSHLAETLGQKNKDSDFVRIGSVFHRWVRDKESVLGLDTPKGGLYFLEKLKYFSDQYVHINDLIANRNINEYLYLVINADFGFTMQPALILAAINYGDSEKVIAEKIKMVSKYLCKVLVWRVWNHNNISQSSMEGSLYQLCKTIRGKDTKDIQSCLDKNPIPLPDIYAGVPILNQANRRKMKVLLTLLTALVARGSGHPIDVVNENNLELEHIWANHYERHLDEFNNENDFNTTRNMIGGLVLLPKSFNASYNDNIYEQKVIHYIEQNILVQTLCKQKYESNPGFLSFKKSSNLPFKPYDHFTRNSIAERSELYRKILVWNWPEAVQNIKEDSNGN